MLDLNVNQRQWLLSCCASPLPGENPRRARLRKKDQASERAKAVTCGYPATAAIVSSTRQRWLNMFNWRRRMDSYLVHLKAMLQRMDTVTSAQALILQTFNDSNREREASHQAALNVLDREDRHAAWDIALEAFGPDAPSPHWYSALRREAELDQEELKAAHSMLYMAQCAAHALIVRELITSSTFTQSDYDLLTRPWREVIGKVHPDDPELHVAGASSVSGWDPENAQEIYDALEDAGLLEFQGWQIPGSFDGRDCAQGVSYCYSQFSDDQIDAYTIDIETWTADIADNAVRRLREEHEAEPRSLLCIVGSSWGVRLCQIQNDSEIPANIAELIVSALGGGRVVAERPIPDPEWFDPKYVSVQAILRDLASAGIQVSAQEPSDLPDLDQVGEYLIASFDDDTFAFAHMVHDSETGVAVPLSLHVFVEDNWADKLPEILNSYFDVDWPHVFIAGDGWVVRLLLDDEGDATDFDLNSAAHAIEHVLGGNVVSSEYGPLPSDRDPGSRDISTNAVGTAAAEQEPPVKNSSGLAADEFDAATRALTRLAAGLEVESSQALRNAFAKRWRTLVTLADLNALIGTHDGGILRFSVWARTLGVLESVFCEHPLTEASLGEALVALGGFQKVEDRGPERQMPSGESPLLRALIAASTNDPDLLIALANDACAMVRFSVATNQATPDHICALLAFDKCWEVADAAILRPGGVPETRAASERSDSTRIWPQNCGCVTPQSDMATSFRRSGLELPALPPFLTDRLRRWSEWFWATQPMPLSIEDYYMGAAKDYIHGPIPDQLAVSHAGTGGNSYALNLRLAAGDLALLVQCGWGGAFGGAEDTAHWNACMRDTSQLLELFDISPTTSTDERRFTVTYSNFREGAWELGHLDADGWRNFEQFDSFPPLATALSDLLLERQVRSPR